MVAMPSSDAAIFTGVARSFCPRPAGRSGCVITRTQSSAPANARSAGTANSLVPKKTPRARVGALDSCGFGVVRERRAFGFGLGERFFFFFRHGRPDVLGFIDVEHAVEMVHLVLEATPEKARAFEFDLLAVAIEAGTDDAFEAREVADHADDRETAFDRRDLAIGNGEFRVDDDEGPVVVVIVLEIDDEEAFADIDLRRGEADARRMVHRLEHIVDELLEERIAEFVHRHFFGDFAERRMPVLDDFADVRHGRHYNPTRLASQRPHTARTGAASRRQGDVRPSDFDEALDRVRLGVAHPQLMDALERRTVAFHEAGHATVAWLTPGADPVRKVTIVPHGQALGLTEQLPAIERHNLSRVYLQTRIAVMLGGRTAEEVVFGEVTTGAEHDLVEATKLARQMVTRWGMSELGLAAFRADEQQPFLGYEIAQGRDYSEATAARVDLAVEQILAVAHEQVGALLTASSDRLHALAEALLRDETLEINALKAILDARSLPPRTNVSRV